MIARTQTNLTPDQLEEFESVFRHFDEDASNTLVRCSAQKGLITSDLLIFYLAEPVGVLCRAFCSGCQLYRTDPPTTIRTG